MEAPSQGKVKKKKNLNGELEVLLSVIENAPFGVFVVKEDGMIEYANEAMAKISGVSAEKFKNLNVYELVHFKEMGLDLKIRGALEGKEFVLGPIPYTSYFEKKRRYRKFTGIPLKSGGVKRAIVFVEDVTDLKEKEEKYKKERETFFSFFENLPVGIIVTDESGKVEYLNREFTNITGYTAEDIPDVKTFLNVAFREGEDKEKIADFWENRRSGEMVDLKIVCKNGTEKEVELKGEYLEDGRVVSVIRDVTGFKMMERELIESERRFRSIFETSRDAIYITTKDGWFIDVNTAFCEMFGEKKEEIMKRNAKDAYVSKEDKIRLKTAIERNGFVKDFEMRLKKMNGEIIDCLLTVTGIRDEQNRIVEYHGIIRDVTEKKKAEEKIRYMAFHDMLTGLPNRSLFADRLSIAMAHARRTNEMVAVMMLDIDRFKDINDLHGHDLGDLVLKEVAERLRNAVRRTDTIARMGGDEFMGVFTNIKKIEDVATVGEKILRVFSTPIAVRDMVFPVTVSVGFSIYPKHGVDLDSLLRKADLAMYEVKQSGRNGFKIYDQEDPS